MSNNALSYLKAFLLERDNFSKIKKARLLNINMLNRDNLLKGIEY
jgi:hypothetical protein